MKPHAQKSFDDALNVAELRNGHVMRFRNTVDDVDIHACKYCGWIFKVSNLPNTFGYGPAITRKCPTALDNNNRL